MFYKIPFTGDVYSEFSQVIVAIAIVIVLSLAWWTTNIRENWHVRTVYFFDTRLRRSRHLQRLTNHTVSSTLVESTQPSQEATATESGEAVAGPDINPGGNPDENKPPDSSSSGANSEVVASSSAREDERTRIIQVMDADANVLRQRRIAFFEARRDTLITPTAEEAAATNSVVSADHQQQIETISDCPIMEHNYADRNDDANTEIQDADEPPDNNIIHDNIRIKLKYINDDLKLVDGRLEELLGDFKRRHFQVELATNKLVKLIFNGQVLQRDNDTLQTYGLFDNCVVHCLIHQQRVSPIEETNSGTSSSMLGNSSSRTNGGSSSNSNNNNRDWDLGNLLIVLISFLLSSAWYFRYQYPQFFTVTATVALVAITGIFTVVSIGMYFPDPEPVRPQAHILR